MTNLVATSFPSDINECLEPGACGSGSCRNLIGSFECTCDDGYTPGPDNRCEGTVSLGHGRVTLQRILLLSWINLSCYFNLFY